MATSSSRHNNSHNHHNHRSLSPSGRFCSSSISSSSSFTKSKSSFTSHESSFYNRSSSPTRVNMFGSGQTASSSVRFAIDNRNTSPSRSFSVGRIPFTGAGGKKKTCMCSPTTHPGSFRCNFHKNLEAKKQSQNQHQASTFQPNRLNMRRSAMTNSLVRIGTVEGDDWMKRALATLIRPSSHQQRRRADFRPRSSRLSTVSYATDEDNRR